MSQFITWPKYWSFSFSISLSSEYSGWFPSGLTDFISLQFKGLSRVFSNTTVQKYYFFSAHLSLWSTSPIHTWLLEKTQLWLYGPFFGKVMALLFNTLSSVIAFLPGSKYLLISWLQLPSTVILEPKKTKQPLTSGELVKFAEPMPLRCSAPRRWNFTTPAEGEL